MMTLIVLGMILLCVFGAFLTFAGLGIFYAHMLFGSGRGEALFGLLILCFGIGCFYVAWDLSPFQITVSASEGK